MMAREKSVLFVCRGNTCRSPFAAAILMKLVTDSGQADEWLIDSGGVAVINEGEPPGLEASKVAESHDMTQFHGGHRARSLTQADFYQFKYIFGMDDSNIQAIERLKPDNSSNQIDLLGNYNPNLESNIITDPFGGDTLRYEQTYNECVIAVKEFWSTKVDYHKRALK